jgi:hypothetical protein
MSFAHTIICLANSRKPKGHCVAGKEKLGNGSWRWLRPVGTTESREVTDADIKFNDDQYTRPLDIVEIEFSKQDDHPYQAENVVIDPDQYWIKTGNVTLDDLAELVDDPQILWESGHHSTSGLNDRVPEHFLQGKRPSLYLIRPHQVKFTVGAEGAQFDDHRRKVRAHFDYNGVSYSLKVSDPLTEEFFLSKQDGQHPAPNVSYLTVSLAELYHGHAYKVVAAVF